MGYRPSPFEKNTSAECLGIINPGGGQKVRFAPDPVPEMFPDKVGAEV